MVFSPSFPHSIYPADDFFYAVRFAQWLRNRLAFARYGSLLCRYATQTRHDMIALVCNKLLLSLYKSKGPLASPHRLQGLVSMLNKYMVHNSISCGIESFTV